jgi:hypothetical protein
MMKIEGSGSASGSIGRTHGSADPDPDPNQNIMDPQHWLKATVYRCLSSRKLLILISVTHKNRKFKKIHVLKCWTSFLISRFSIFADQNPGSGSLFS